MPFAGGTRTQAVRASGELALAASGELALALTFTQRGGVRVYA
jgi:hypothetical protein